MTPKYRQLTQDELQLLEKDFIDFLVVNGITADEWVQIKASDSEKVEKFVVLFSDVVFEKMMRKTEYLMKKMGDVLLCFHFAEKEATLLLVQNLRSDKPVTELAPSDLELKEANISRQIKSYQKPRELEIFELITGGAEVSDGKIYKTIESSDINLK